MPKYLQRRYRRWYAVLDVPKDVRGKIGTRRFFKSLETESQTKAERLVLGVVAHWKALIEKARNTNSVLDELEVTALRLKSEGWSPEDIARDRSAEVEYAFLIYENDEREPTPEERKTARDYLDADFVLSGSKKLISRYIDDYLASATGTEKTLDMRRRTLQSFAIKFKYAEDVNRDALSGWIENDLVDTQGQALSTVKRNLSFVKDFWSYMVRKHKVEAIPFDGLLPRDRRTPRQRVETKRQTLTPLDYRRIVAAVPQKDQTLSDLITLAGHTGARIEELCALKVEDVSEDRFYIREAKSEAGIREIPIHSAIADLVARLKKETSDGYLLSGLTLNKYGDRSNAIGKRFGRLKTSLGYGRNLVFHSIRKGVARHLQNADIPETTTARLLGHDFRSMTYGVYSGGIAFTNLKQAIEAIDWSLRSGA